MAEDDGALLGKACADGVDLPKRRCEAEQPANLPRSAFDAWVGLMRRPLWGRRWIAYLPVEWHTGGGILGQQAVQERRACARQASDEERPSDLLRCDVGVLLAIATGYHQLDAIFAAFVGVTILWTGWQVVRESVIGLMDVAVDPKRLSEIRDIIAANAEGAIEAHDVRTRQAGRLTFIEFHLVVVGSMSVEAAHAICDRIEAKLREAVGEAQVTIHVEPENKAKHSGIVVV